jgi:hypothetical protein
MIGALPLNSIKEKKMEEIIFKIGDRVRMTGRRGLDVAKIIRIFKSADGLPETELFVLQRQTPDPLTGSYIDTAFRVEIGPLDPMDAERLRRRMEFEVASARRNG